MSSEELDKLKTVMIETVPTDNLGEVEYPASAWAIRGTVQQTSREQGRGHKGWAQVLNSEFRTLKHLAWHGREQAACVAAPGRLESCS